MKTLEREFEVKKRILADKNRDSAIENIANYLKDYYLSYGVVLPTDTFREDAVRVFECAKLENILDDLNLVKQ